MKMSKHPDISVVIPSYNGERTLPELLKSLQDQSFRNFEVTVVVDGSTDNTISFKAKDWDLDLRWIMQENKGRAGARNAGAAKAKSDILLFLDDDTFPAQDLLQKHFDLQNSNKSIVVGILPFIINNNESDFQKFRKYLTKKWLKDLPGSVSDPLPKNKPFIAAGNFSIRRDIFNDIGGFSTALSDGEDLDLAIRLTKKNVPIYFEKSLIAYHSDNAPIKEYIQRLRDYKLMYDQIPDKGKVDYELRDFEFEDLGMLKKLFYSISCHKSVLSLVERDSIWLRLIPRIIRYRFYDMLVTGFSIFYIDRKIV